MIPPRTLLGVALGGLALFAAAFWLSWQPPSGWEQVQLDLCRARATEAVREITGLDVSTFTLRSSARFDRALMAWQGRYAKDPFDRFLTPLQIDMHFGNPGAGDIRVVMSADAQIRAVRLNLNRVRRGTEPQPEIPAERILKILARGNESRFQPDNRDENQDRKRFRWKAASSHPSLSWVATVNYDRGRLRSGSIEPSIDRAGIPESREGGGTFSRETKQSFWVILVVASVPWVIIGYIAAWMRKVIDHRLALEVGAVFAVVEIIGEWAGDRSYGRAIVSGLATGALTAVGRVAASVREWPRWQGFMLLAKGQGNCRSLAEGLRDGLAWAGLYAALPFLLLLPWPGSAYSTEVFGAAALSRMPLAAALAPLVSKAPYALFVFLMPIVRRRTGAPASWILFGSLAAIVMFAISSPPEAGVWPAAIWAVTASALLTVVYFLHGLLAVLVTVKTASMLTAAGMLLRAGAGLAPNAIVILGGIAVVAALAIRMSKTAPELALPNDRNIQTAYLSERERLKAEFSLAQQAQQRLLPQAPPGCSGITIAASCQPALDVGGDLYDYFELPGGRLGVCVADVSGKGMPAALYMTLTKGVLAAAAPDCQDLAELTKHLNRHIYACGRRKIFVTAALAAVDSQTRTVDYVRAGHNPAVLHSPASGARYLSTRGMGLGMAGDRIFERALAVERLQLDPGDTLILYSDGVTEAMNEFQEQYGEERLLALIQRLGGRAPASLLDEIKRDLAAFTGTEPAHDDVTIVVIQASTA